MPFLQSDVGWRCRGALVLLTCTTLALGACSVLQPRGDGAEGETKRVYRVQLVMTEDKEEAVEVQARARQWWADRPDSEKPPMADVGSSDEAVVIEWRSPLYRVRLGPFASREEAESVLGAAQKPFPDAFVVPDRVESP